MDNLIVFSLRSNWGIAKKVAERLGAKLGEVFFDNFADGEVLVKTLTDVKDKDVLIIESTAKKAQETLFELLLLIDSIKRSGAKSVKLYIPYFGYSRQERVSFINEPVSCEVVAKILDTAKVDEILTFDLHHKDIEKFFKTKINNLPTTSLFVDYYKSYFKKQNIDLKNVVIVSPDHGANLRADALVNGLVGSKKVILTKYRPKPNFAEHLTVDSDQIKDKICIIIDDIIDTGGTIISATEVLLNGGAKQVLVGASHGVFSHGSLDRLLNSPIADITVTNTIESKLSSRVNVLDITPLIKY